VKLALIYNPRQSRGRMARVRRLAEALEARGHSVAHHACDSFDCARDAPDAGLLVIAGGDGSARLTLSRQSDLAALPPVAIYPAGTINLLARELGYPRDPAQFTRRIEGAAGRIATRLATLNGAPFLACASLGFDAQTVAEVSEPLKRRIGRLAYGAALLAQIARWPRHAFRLDTGSETLEAEALFVLRGRYYAGPWTLDRGAHLETGTLRILALPRARRRDMVRLLIHALTGSRRPDPRWRFVEAEQLTVTCAKSRPVQADGDLVAATPVSFAMTSQVVTFV